MPALLPIDAHLPRVVEHLARGRALVLVAPPGAGKTTRVVVMSGTLDAAPVAAFLGGCPVLEVRGRPHPVEVGYVPGLAPAAAVRDAASHPGGHILCFLPGAAEIREAEAALAGTDLEVLPLHGALDAKAQDLALAPSARRKAILATNIAETSLTVDGFDTVVDSGWHK